MAIIEWLSLGCQWSILTFPTLSCKLFHFNVTAMKEKEKLYSCQGHCRNSSADLRN